MLEEFFPAENKEFTVGTRVVGLHGQPNISAASRTKKLHSWRASFELQQLLSHKPASYSVACSRHVDLPKECNSPSVILCHSYSISYFVVPKSAILAVVSLCWSRWTSMFSGFRFRCVKPLLCMNASPRATWVKSLGTSRSSRLTERRSSSTHSMINHGSSCPCPPVRTSNTLTIFGWKILNSEQLLGFADYLYVKALQPS